MDRQMRRLDDPGDAAAAWLACVAVLNLAGAGVFLVLWLHAGHTGLAIAWFLIFAASAAVWGARWREARRRDKAGPR